LNGTFTDNSKHNATKRPVAAYACLCVSRPHAAPITKPHTSVKKLKNPKTLRGTLATTSHFLAAVFAPSFPKKRELKIEQSVSIVIHFVFFA
jgi:hypothetical protein